MNSKSLRTSVGILALALVCAAGAQSLDGINAKKVGKGLQVQIVGQDLHKPVASWNNTRNTYQLTFDGKLNGPAKTVRVDSNGVSAVQYSWISRKSGKVRVSMYLGKAAKPELVQMDGLWAVNFNVEDKKSAPVANTPKDEFTLPPIQEPKKAAPQKQANNLVSNFTSNMMVDLDFVNTDIVQILKALALQANVNIVTSPDVAGRITVTLDSVSVKDALDIVTALGGVRYAKVGNTFVVTSNSRFSDTIQQIGGRIDVSSETRVVPLFSGEGTQIKAAVLQTISPSTITGRYDLVLPSDKVQVASKSTTAPVDANAGDKGAGAAQGSEISTTSDTTLTGAKRDDYMVVVGTPGRLDEVEKMIRSVDQQICSALGIKTNGGTGIIQRTYEPKGISAEELYAVIKSDKSLDFGNVKILATPKNSMSKQAVVLSGRAADVENLMTILENLDSQPQGGATFYEVVDLKFIKPQVAAVELMGSVAGLKAAILPPPVDPLQGIEYTHDATFAAGAADRMNGQNGNNGGNGGNGGAGGGGEGNSGGAGGGGGSEKNDRATMAGRKADKTTQSWRRSRPIAPR